MGFGVARYPKEAANYLYMNVAQFKQFICDIDKIARRFVALLSVFLAVLVRVDTLHFVKQGGVFAV